LSRAELRDALLRIAIFNSKTNFCTYFDLSEKEAVLSAAGQEVGSVSESLDVEYQGNIARIAFPTNHLLTILEHYYSSTLTMTLTGPEGPCGISGKEDKDYMVIVMPMKILDEVNFSEEQV
jgi:DNA polymerase-3 subunit beta